MRGLATVVVVVVLHGLGSPLARADSNQEQADKLFVEGRDLLKQGNAKAACEKFEAAHKLDAAAPGLMLNLGICYEKQGKVATSLRWLRQAVQASLAAKLPDYAKDANDRITELEKKVARITFDVSAAPADTQVTIDSNRIENLSQPVEVDGGSHTIEAAAASQPPFTQTVDVANGSTKTVVINFAPDKPPVVTTPAGKSPWPRRLLGIGVGVAGAGVAVFSTVTAKNTQDDYNAKGGSKPTGKMTLLGVTTVTGILAVGAGAYLIITAPKAEKRETAVAPVVTHDQVGIAVSGWF
ncbi:MAG TPA: tetratricopeptide repeat protein [Kofleriaceae bacterium]|nr:tetratricopeptide repeat protein [Kofleriaceae bacterium]